MKTETSKLTGAALDWAVGKCQPLPDHGQRFVEDGYHPSTDWAQGGPIIEREKISVNPEYSPCSGWVADTRNIREKTHQSGPTPLIAAMRCYVASKLGDTVDVPEGIA